MTLREVADELPSLDELAGKLSMSKRSLNRYLAREATSFRGLAGRIPHEIACERLTLGEMGFSDQSNFSKAFRAREGCIPGAYRQAHVAHQR